MSDFPFTENPSTGNTMTENPPQLNTKQSNTDTSIINKSITKESLITEFEKLWKLYPKRQGKQNALKAYEKARKGGASYEEVENGIRAYIEYVKGKDPQYIKMGSSFFNQRAWQDDWSINEDSRIRTESRKTASEDFGDFSAFGEINF